MAETPPSETTQRLSAAGWLALIVMLGFLVAAIAYAVWAFGQLSEVRMSTLGWVFLGMGVVFTFLVGAGLMGLVFYSSRKNYDR